MYPKQPGFVSWLIWCMPFWNANEKHFDIVKDCQGSCQKTKQTCQYVTYSCKTGRKSMRLIRQSFQYFAFTLRFQVEREPKPRKNWEKRWLQLGTVGGTTLLRIGIEKLELCKSDHDIACLRLNGSPFPNIFSIFPPQAPPANTWCCVQSMRRWQVEWWPGHSDWLGLPPIKLHLLIRCCHSHVLMV